MIVNSANQEDIVITSVANQAVDWYARLSGDNTAESDWQRFWIWCDRDPAHAAAYDHVAAQCAALQDFADEPEIMEMRLQALADAPALKSRHWMGAVAATIMAVLITSTIFLWPQLTGRNETTQIAALPTAERPAETPVPAVAAPGASATPVANLAFRSEFQTGTGERSKFTLPDGSVLELNTDSRVNVDFAAGVRNLKLARGEAIFHVAHDKSRPFIVTVANNRVIALGTVFSVRHAPDEAIVTLLEGKVRIERLQHGVATEAAQLVPGEQLTTYASEPFQIRKADFARVASWADGRLVFDNEPLGNVVKEINRYTHRKLIVGSEELTDVRVSGTFRIQSSDQFAKALEAGFPITAKRDDATGKIFLTPKRVSQRSRLAPRAPEGQSIKKD